MRVRLKLSVADAGLFCVQRHVLGGVCYSRRLVVVSAGTSGQALGGTAHVAGWRVYLGRQFGSGSRMGGWRKLCVG